MAVHWIWDRDQTTRSISGSNNDDQDAIGNLLWRAGALFPDLASVRQPLSVFVGNPNRIAKLFLSVSLDKESLDQGPMDDGINNCYLISEVPIRENSKSAPSTDDPITIPPDLARRIRIEPDLAENHLELANDYFQVHNFEKAQSELEEAMHLEPANAGSHMCLGFFYLSRGKNEAGISELHEAVKIVPFRGEQRSGLARALDSIDRTPEAITELQDFLRTVNPAAVEPSDLLVNLYIDRNDLQSAIAELRRSLKASSLRFPDQAKLVVVRLDDEMKLGDLLRKNHELDAAEQQYLYLMRVKPEFASFYNGYGSLLLYRRRFDQAISEYTEVLRLAPDFPRAHQNLGLCLSLKKDFDGAISEFQKALELYPQEPHSRVLLGTAFGQKGNLSAAMEQFQQAIREHPEDPDAHTDIAYALMQLKGAPGAVKELREVLKAQPGSADALNNIAWIYATSDDPKLRDPVESLAFARQAVQNSPAPNPAFLDTLAEALLLNGHSAEALANEQKAIELDPENQELKARLPRFREAAQSSASPK